MLYEVEHKFEIEMAFIVNRLYVTNWQKCVKIKGKQDKCFRTAQGEDSLSLLIDYIGLSLAVWFRQPHFIPWLSYESTKRFKVIMYFKDNSRYGRQAKLAIWHVIPSKANILNFIGRSWNLYAKSEHFYDQNLKQRVGGCSYVSGYHEWGCDREYMEVWVYVRIFH